MKNKKRYIYIFTIIMIILAIICFVLIINSNSLERKIKNIKWYNYNKDTATYNVLQIKSHKLTLLINNENLSNCTKYRYNSTDKKLILNCGKEIILKEYDDNYLLVSMNDKEMKFYKSTDETLNYEFEKFYEKSILEFKNEKKQIFELLKINPSSIPYDDEKYVLIFHNKDCSNIECTLIMDILEKWHVESQNLYLIDLKDIDISSLNNINSMFNVNIHPNSNYPYILNKIKDEIHFREFKCEDLYCSNWRNYINKFYNN